MDRDDRQSPPSATASDDAGSLIPAFDTNRQSLTGHLSEHFAEAVRNWLSRSTSTDTRTCYERDLRQFLDFVGISPQQLERLTDVRPEHVAAWRNELRADGNASSTVRRKLTTVRSLFSYLQLYGYAGANPAHAKFVATPAVARDGKTPGLTPNQCRALLDAPDTETPVGIRDRAMLAVLAFSACRVGELVRLRAGDFATTGEHRVLHIQGKGGKERIVALHPEAVERLTEWVCVAGIADDRDRPLFRPSCSPHKKGRDGFYCRPLTVRSVEKRMKRYTRALGFDETVTVHSLRVTALTTARECGSDIVDLQDFAGHADPRTTLSYIRNRNRLSTSPTYVLHY